MNGTNSAHGTTDGQISDEPISHRVVFAVAKRADVRPNDLPPLYDSIDPDALNAVVDSGDTDLVISFSFSGYEVTIDGERTVHVR